MSPRNEPREIRREIAAMPVDSDVTVRSTPHPLTLLREHADLLPVIAAGGALGSLARWGLSRALPHTPSEFAWGTLLTNVSGALALGLLMAFVLDVWAGRRYLRPFVGVGILGGYTTFSTWMLDTRGLLASGHVGVAFVYLAGTLVAGTVAVFLGLAAGRWAIDARRTTSVEVGE